MAGIRAAWTRLAGSPHRIVLAAAVAAVAILGGIGFAIALNSVRQPIVTGASLPASATIDASASEDVSPSSTPTPSATPTLSPTATATPSPSATATGTPTATATPTPSPTPKTGTPQPVLILVRAEDYRDTPEGDGTRFTLSIENWREFADGLFETSTAYPCGLNPRASRTVVRIFDADNHHYIYGFCGLTKAEDLVGIWFAVPSGEDQPRSVQVIMIDQLTGVEYHSTILDLPGD